MARSTDAADAVIFPGGVPSRTVTEERKRKEEIAEPEPLRWDSNPIVQAFNGVDREFFSIGALAWALNRQPVTIRLWEDQGRLPKSRYRTRPPQRGTLEGKKLEGRRRYTREQIEAVIEAADLAGVNDPNRPTDWTLFRDRVVSAWKNLS